MSDEDHSDESKTKDKRIIILSLVGSVAIVAALMVWLMPQWYQNYAPKQPIPFSHKIHAGQYGIDCRYCHSSVEHAAFSEVPGLEVCMNCHSVVKTDSPYIKEITAAYKANKPMITML